MILTACFLSKIIIFPVRCYYHISSIYSRFIRRATKSARSIFFSLFFPFLFVPSDFHRTRPSFLRVLTLILIMETHIDARESFYIILRNATKRYCSNKLYRSSLGKAKITEKLNPFDKSSFRHSSTPPSNSIEFN